MKIEFTPPKAFIQPEGVKPGENFELVCTLRMDGNKLCLVKLGDVKMEGYAKDSRPDYKEYSKSISEGMTNE